VLNRDKAFLNEHVGLLDALYKFGFDVLYIGVGWFLGSNVVGFEIFDGVDSVGNMLFDLNLLLTKVLELVPVLEELSHCRGKLHYLSQLGLHLI
jgi:hypothetical protein